MNCFYHQTTAAVGLCKHCSKALCAECVVDLGHGISCPGHEKDVALINAFVAKVEAERTPNSSHKYWPPLLNLAFGLAFALFGLFGQKEISVFTVLVGACLVAYSLGLLMQARAR